MPQVPPLTGVAGTLPIPNTTPTPAPGELVRAEDVQQAAQGLLNQDATLEARRFWYKTATVPAVNSPIGETADVWRCSTPLAPLTHTVSDPPLGEGASRIIWRQSVGAFDITLRRDDASVIATLPTATQSSVQLVWYAGGLGWQIVGGYAFV